MVPSDIEERHDFDSEVIFEGTLHKRFAWAYATETDGIEINFFRLLRLSNKALVLFDRIVDWVKRYKVIPVQNGSSSLMKREYPSEIELLVVPG